MNYKTYREDFITNSSGELVSELKVVESGRMGLCNRKIDIPTGEFIILQSDDGVFYKVSVTEYGDIEQIEKPTCWDTLSSTTEEKPSAVDRIKPLGEEELPPTPPENHMCRTREPGDNIHEA